MFYTYLWLREDGTPYYVGKGKGNRAFTNHSHTMRKPSNKENIIVQEHESESEAFVAEMFLINYYGRLDLETGCLRNFTDGGENPPSRLGTTFNHTEDTKERMRIAHAGKKMSKDSRSKMSVSKLGNKNALGHVVSETAKQRMSGPREKSSYCRRGHEKTPDNTGKGRKCKLCQKIHNDARYK